LANYRHEVISSSEEIKPVALATIELSLIEGISLVERFRVNLKTTFAWLPQSKYYSGFRDELIISLIATSSLKKRYTPFQVPLKPNRNLFTETSKLIFIL